MSSDALDSRIREIYNEIMTIQTELRKIAESDDGSNANTEKYIVSEESRTNAGRMVFILWSVLLRLSNQNKANSASQMLLESLRVQSGMAHLGGKVRAGQTPARDGAQVRPGQITGGGGSGKNSAADGREQQAINVFNPSKGAADTSYLNKDAQYRYTFGAPAPGGYGNTFDKARNGGKPASGQGDDKGA